MSEVRDVRLEQAARSDWAEAASGIWSTAPRLWEHMTGASNMVEAARAFDFARWRAPPDATILDLGCGSGWLAAMLSAEPKVAHVIAWDSSPHLLEQVLPEMVELVGGDIARIERVCGDFVPLMLGDTSQDLVVMSSAFHHAGDPRRLLGELRRVPRPDGAVVLLNETPWKRLMVLGFATRMYLAALAGLVRGTPVARSRAPRRRSRPLRRPARGPGLHGRSVARARARARLHARGPRRRTLVQSRVPRADAARPNLAHIVLRLR